MTTEADDGARQVRRQRKAFSKVLPAGGLPEKTEYPFPFFIVFWFRYIQRDLTGFFRTMAAAKKVLDDFFLKRAQSSYSNDKSDNVLRFTDDNGVEHVLRVDEATNAYVAEQSLIEEGFRHNYEIQLAREVFVARARSAAGLTNDLAGKLAPPFDPGPGLSDHSSQDKPV